MTPAQYAANWAVEASSFAKHGDYAWMASFLPKRQPVLEIGCGSGASTLALIQAGHPVVSVEQNEHMAEAAYDLLLSQGISVKRHTLDDLTPEGLATEHQAHIVLGDVFDVGISSRLPADYFNAMTCWLIGSTPAFVNATLAEHAGEPENWDPADYRWLIHQRCVALSKEILKAKSSLHFVDRAGISSWASKDQYRQGWAEGYNEKLKLGGLLVTKDIMFRKFSVALGTSQIQYGKSIQNAEQGVGVFSAVNISVN
ncbi:bifunctional 2-polyprenyl-6-hydroxyphenol methylase/3-demethylubiquinol 3-O-methyltransferase UbiG [Pseudomonas sp. UMAB-40]|uniref:class I SAM-dependent methyltransferase n=1 Tax=Pseudomonas sp. UMAB-40 TaxID=1365407 RepID=UPI001C575C06|nr:class I SAM-dependent methyltransferase [Pseudomonas sp. UMAB-40]